MDKLQFGAILPTIVANLVDRIALHGQMSEDEAISQLYHSTLYTMLEREETKIWQYSTEKLLDLFMQEKQTGQMDFPDY